MYLTEPLLDRARPAGPGARRLRRRAPARDVIDCDVHNVVGPIETLEPYLDDHWREVIATSQFAGPTDQAASAEPGDVAARRPGAGRRRRARPDRRGAARPACSTRSACELAILGCDYGVESVRNPDAAAALATAVNDWQLAEWLEPEPRLRAAIVVAAPAARRWRSPRSSAGPATRGSSPSTCRCARRSRTATGSGGRCGRRSSEHELVAELHFGGSAGIAADRLGMADLVARGVRRHGVGVRLAADQPDRRGRRWIASPGCAISLIESGFGWLPAFMWRFDKGWRGLRREIPWTRRLPSEYVREHIRVSLQPVDGPPDPAELARVIDQLGSDRMLMFSTDYPHRHCSEELDAVPAGLPPAAVATAARSPTPGSTTGCERPRQARGRRLRHPQRAALRAGAAAVHAGALARGAGRRRPAGGRGRGPPRDARRPLLPGRRVPAGDPARRPDRRVAAVGRPTRLGPAVHARAAARPLRARATAC